MNSNADSKITICPFCNNNLISEGRYKYCEDMEHIFTIDDQNECYYMKVYNTGIEIGKSPFDYYISFTPNAPKEFIKIEPFLPQECKKMIEKYQSLVAFI